MILQKVGQFQLEATSPFNFLYTVWKPSHFPTTLEMHSKEKSWRTFRLSDSTSIGLVMKPLTDSTLSKLSDGISVEVYAETGLTKQQEDELIKRIRWSYCLDFELQPFYAVVASDRILREPLSQLYGMRSSCPESMFEILVISLVLQNTTVARSAQMLSNLLRKYGDQVSFDGKELAVFCDVRRLANATQEELRNECRLGYRAKYLPAMAEGFVTGVVNEDQLRGMDENSAKQEFMKLKGVGPYSAYTVLSSSLQNPSSLNLDSWNTKIFSQQIYGHNNASKSEVYEYAQRTWGEYKGLAALYILENIFRLQPASPLIS